MDEFHVTKLFGKKTAKACEAFKINNFPKMEFQVAESTGNDKLHEKTMILMICNL